MNQDKTKLFKMKHKFLFLIISLLTLKLSNAQVKGCTDKQANNYNSSATENDGSCTYNKTNYTTKIICSKLSDTLIESSGLIYYNNLFWTINDSDNPPVLYAFDSLKGHIVKQVFIKNRNNNDWEDLSQDENYIYIGDFGNNNGSRKDLQVLKIKKSELKTNSVQDTIEAESIRFALSDQTDFNPGSQNHNYDLEAMCVLNDSIHLFSKNWADKKSRHYICSTDTGYYSLSPIETLETNGLVTGACVSSNGSITLCGYNNSNGASFLYLMWDYKNNQYLSGNRRRIDLGTVISTGQNEAVCLKGNTVYMSNEKQIPNAQLQRIETQQWLSIKTNDKSNFVSYCKDHVLYIETTMGEVTLKITDSTGKMVYSNLNFKGEIKLDVSQWASGIYTLELGNGNTQKIIIE